VATVHVGANTDPHSGNTRGTGADRPGTPLPAPTLRGGERSRAAPVAAGGECARVRTGARRRTCLVGGECSTARSAVDARGPRIDRLRSRSLSGANRRHPRPCRFRPGGALYPALCAPCAPTRHLGDRCHACPPLQGRRCGRADRHAAVVKGISQTWGKHVERAGTTTRSDSWLRLQRCWRGGRGAA
jgi:hypothetical protein